MSSRNVVINFEGYYLGQAPTDSYQQGLIQHTTQVNLSLNNPSWWQLVGITVETGYSALDLTNTYLLARITVSVDSRYSADIAAASVVATLTGNSAWTGDTAGVYDAGISNPKPVNTIPVVDAGKNGLPKVVPQPVVNDPFNIYDSNTVTSDVWQSLSDYLYSNPPNYDPKSFDGLNNDISAINLPNNLKPSNLATKLGISTAALLALGLVAVLAISKR